jgi:hypothetical protein
MSHSVNPQVSALSIKSDFCYRLFIILALSTLVLPAFFFGPYLPLPDLIIFVAVHSYPIELSYGPDVFYVFQYTYILVHIITRALRILGVPSASLVPLFYAIQAVGSFFIINGILSVLTKNRALKALALAICLLSFMNGQFLWGGPLAYSFGYLLAGFSAVLVFKESEDGKDRFLPMIILSAMAISSHPFMAIFVLVNLASRLVFITRYRKGTCLGIFLILLYCFIIVKDNPEKIDVKITDLFYFMPHIIERLETIFFCDNDTLKFLLPDLYRYSLIRIFFSFKSFIVFFGIITAPVYLFSKKASVPLKLLSIQATMAAIIFFFSVAYQNYISFWPDRILAAQNYLFFINGLVFAWVLVNHLRINDVFFNKIFSFFCKGILLKSALVFFILYSAICQSQLFYKANSSFLEQYSRLKEITLDKAPNSVLYTDVGYASPFYLAAVPFVLYSDLDVINNNTRIHTHWHQQKRHNFRYGRFDDNLAVNTVSLTMDSDGRQIFVPEL